MILLTRIMHMPHRIWAARSSCTPGLPADIDVHGDHLISYTAAGNTFGVKTSERSIQHKPKKHKTESLEKVHEKAPHLQPRHRQLGLPRGEVGSGRIAQQRDQIPLQGRHLGGGGGGGLQGHPLPRQSLKVGQIYGRQLL